MARKSPEFVQRIDSPNRQKLMAMAEADGVSVDGLRTLLWMLDVHVELLAILPAAKNLQRIIHSSTRLGWGDAWEAIQIDEFLPALNWVVNKGDDLGQIHPDLVRRTNGTGRNPVLGRGVTEYPVYSLLTELPGPGIDDIFWFLVGHVFFSNCYAVRGSSNLEAYEFWQQTSYQPLPNSSYESAKLVRKFADPKSEFDEFRSVFSALPVRDTPEQFLVSLNSHMQTNLDLNNKIGPIVQYLGRCQEKLTWRTRKVEEGGTRTGSKGDRHWYSGQADIDKSFSFKQTVKVDRADPCVDTGGIIRINLRNSKPEQRKDALENDIDPSELDDDDVIELVALDCKTAKKDAGAQVMAARNRVKHIRRNNQLLLNAYDGLTIDEITQLRLKVHTRLLLLTKEGNSCDRAKVEPLMLVHVLLAAGGDLKRAAELRFVEAEQKDADMPLAWVMDSKQGIWRVKSISPDYQTQIEGIAGQVRPQAVNLDLLDVGGMRERINKFSWWQSPKNGDRVFESNPDQLERELKELLQEWFPKGRVTIPKIENALWHAINAKVPDPVVASLITGTEQRLASVRLFYSAFSEKYLQKTYASVMRDWHDKQLKARSADQKEKSPKSQKSEVSLADENDAEGDQQSANANVLGARMRLSLQSAQQLFSEVRTKIPAKVWQSDPQLTEIHNWYAFYCLLHYAYASGHRAVRTPFPSLEQVDLATGWLAIADKDDGSGHKARMIKLTPAACAQMRAWHDYRYKLLQVWPDDTQLPIFFLGPDRRVIEIRPTIVKDKLKPILDIPPNAHRKFLRSELTERGCPVQAIDALLGHWYDGEEPFGQFSSFSYSHFSNILDGFMTSIQRELGMDRLLKLRMTKTGSGVSDAAVE